VDGSLKINSRDKVRVAIMGGGPSGLMAAALLSSDPRVEVRVFERRPALGWKLLVAGSSRLNVSHGGDPLRDGFREHAKKFQSFLDSFSREAWLTYLESLGQKTFLGTSNRWLLSDEKAGSLLKVWRESLLLRGVEIIPEHEWVSVEESQSGWLFGFSHGGSYKADKGIFSLGSTAWESAPSSWMEEFRRMGIPVKSFFPTNCGFSFEASKEFFEQHQGKPLKGLRLTTPNGSALGELMITSYGFEGAPIYRLGCSGVVQLDLKPDLSVELLEERIRSARGGVEKRLVYGAKLSPGSLALALELLKPKEMDFARLAQSLKSLTVELKEPRPLTESISAGGGVDWAALDDDLQLVEKPGLFCVGEMVDWWAPTGGFLIQGSVSMGAHVAFKLLNEMGVSKELVLEKILNSQGALQ
jgi:predicted Rossmann fold flavoprotein